MLSKKYLHLCYADTWLCPWRRADYYFVTLCFQENPYLFTKTNSNTVISELISDDDQDSASDDFPPAAAVALAVCLTAVVVIVVVFVWRTRSQDEDQRQENFSMLPDHTNQGFELRAR